MTRHPLRFAIVALGLVASVSRAALFDDDEARKRIADTNVRLGQVQRQLEERIASLEQQLKSGGLIDLANQIDLMRGDMAKLRGQIEVLTYELAEVQKRQRDLYVDLDSRMRKVETAQVAAADAAAASAAAAAASSQASAPPPDPALPSGVAGGMPSTSAAASPPGDAAREQRAYDAALDLFKRGDYAGAIAAFGSFLRSYPRTALSPSAQYWIGNAHFARRDFRAAITAQRTLVANYPDSNKVPDALLNVASAQSELGDAAGARRTLEDLVAKYPQSEAAGKARQRLASR